MDTVRPTKQPDRRARPPLVIAVMLVVAFTALLATTVPTLAKMTPWDAVPTVSLVVGFLVSLVDVVTPTSVGQLTAWLATMGYFVTTMVWGQSMHWYTSLAPLALLLVPTSGEGESAAFHAMRLVFFTCGALDGNALQTTGRGLLALVSLWNLN